ncbi:MAG: RsmE family RNA methyltransferase [Phycisphaerales bacterium]|jgi:16S rRNA (uracil1498-N3)-methyltransferase|nr:RsmE family RNA methyltransferase [Phycisphaerales bacterium]
MGTHRVMVDEAIPATGDILSVLGDEAQHAARVKRLEPGDTIELLDGSGRIATARIEGVSKDRVHAWRLDARIEAIREEPPGRPRVEVWAAAPKGPRAEDMVDMLSQVGAASWVPLRAERSVVDPREGKLSRLGRVARESAKQCGRAWVMEVGEAREPAEAFEAEASLVIVADASGTPWSSADCDAVRRSERVRMLVGPEGGWSPREMDEFAAHGASVRRFGPHVMRIETAAIVACARVVGELASG